MFLKAWEREGGQVRSYSGEETGSVRSITIVTFKPLAWCPLTQGSPQSPVWVITDNAVNNNSVGSPKKQVCKA